MLTSREGVSGGGEGRGNMLNSGSVDR